MKKKRLLVVVLGALVALAVAVPAAVALSGLAGESGYIRMYQYDNVDGTYQIANPRSTVRFAYDAKVEGYSVCWSLVGTKLPTDVSDWSLVQIDDVWWDDEDGEGEWEVTVVAQGTAKKGMLSLKGVTEFAGPDWEGWHRFSGAELWLVPTDDVCDHTDSFVIHTDEDFCVESDWYLASLGVPTEFDDYNYYEQR